MRLTLILENGDDITKRTILIPDEDPDLQEIPEIVQSMRQTLDEVKNPL